MSKKALPRLQHEGFGKEIRSLLGSKKVADRELAGIVTEELDALAKNKADGKKHKNEDTLEDDLCDVGYLRRHGQGFSFRAYFSVVEGTIYMLHLDNNKRRTALTDSTKRLPKARLREVRSAVSEIAIR